MNSAVSFNQYKFLTEEHSQQADGRWHIALYSIHADARFVNIYRVVQKVLPLFYLCDNLRKCTPLLTTLSLLEQEIYDA